MVVTGLLEILDVAWKYACYKLSSNYLPMAYGVFVKIVR